MTKMRRLTIRLLAVGMLAVVSGPAQATTSSGPYYATPSWDRKLRCDAQATCPRFIVLSNWGSAAVLDKETGLVWERSPATTTANLHVARTDCARRTVGGRMGWRLPSVHELASLADTNTPSGTPILPPGHPFMNVQAALYWSGTKDSSDPGMVWAVGFSSGGDIGVSTAAGSAHVWCVRGGQNHTDAY